MKTIYECEICRARYDQPGKALACEAQALPTDIKVGDIIKKHDQYGWHTGPDHWIMFNTGTFHGRSMRDFYWLVIAVEEKMGSDNGRHCNQITCISRGIVNGPSVDGRGEWGIDTFNQYLEKGFGTDAEVVNDPPAKVRAEADAFLQCGFVIGNDRGTVTVLTKKGKS